MTLGLVDPVNIVGGGEFTLPETWCRALESYRYPVDLRRFKDRTAFPDWFNMRLAKGDRAETIAFENRFRRLAGTDLAAWYEVIYWKMYSQGGRRDYRTRLIVEQLRYSKTKAQDLLDACRSYVARPSRQALDVFHRLFRFKTRSIAIVATFPAFLDPECFPMVDTRIAQWVQYSCEQFNAADPGAPRLFPPAGGSLVTRHYPFIEVWTEWCRYQAKKLREATQFEWRARDVEMAIFHAWGRGGDAPQYNLGTLTC